MISIIAVIGKNNELGLNNNLLWHLPNDLKFFKETTTSKKIVMGHNTFISIGRPLPNRENIVITRDNFDNVIIMTKEEVLEKYLNTPEEIFVIGGAKIYNYFIDYATKLYLTEVPLSTKADVFFPNFNKEDYKKTILKENNDNNITYNHVLYEKF